MLHTFIRKSQALPVCTARGASTTIGSSACGEGEDHGRLEPMTADHALSNAAPTVAPQTRWEAEFTGANWRGYLKRFQKMIEDGTDLGGEARFIDMMADRNSAVLDAGCGTGRVAAIVAASGHQVVGVDKDSGQIEAGRALFPSVKLIAQDLLSLSAQDLADNGAPAEFDIIALPGNVMVFLAPGTERAVLANLLQLLKPGGRLVAGFATDRPFTVAQMDAAANAVGLQPIGRFGTWQLNPFTAESDWAVCVYRFGEAV